MADRAVDEPSSRLSAPRLGGAALQTSVALLVLLSLPPSSDAACNTIYMTGTPPQHADLMSAYMGPPTSIRKWFRE